jgi:hypothetical protein
MDSRQPQEAKPDVPSRTGPLAGGESADTGAGAGGTAGGAVRRYPKPPAFIPRFIMLCLRPETWAEVARYPTRFTVIPLVVAVILAGAVVGFSESAGLLSNLQSFAASYDARYPALELTSDGVLHARADLSSPVRFENSSGTGAGAVLIDPTGKTVPESIKSNVIFVTDKEILFIMADGEKPISRMPLSKIFKWPLSAVFTPPSAGQPAIINGSTMKAFLDDKGASRAALLGFCLTLLLSVGNALWAAFMMFLVSPLIMLAAAGGIKAGDGPDRRLLLPRRAVYRMAGAILVPLLMLGAGLQATGHPVMLLLGPQGGTLFWFFSTSALALWTGVMARKMYGPKEKPRRAA